MINYIIAGLILAVWIFVAMNFSWSPNVRLSVNLFAGLGAIILLGLVHWIPFWLIFLK